MAKDLVWAFEGKEESSQSNLGELVPAEIQVCSRHIDLCFALVVSDQKQLAQSGRHIVPYSW